MHEYYGNSIFTLCLGSASTAIEGFLRPRTAWTWSGTKVEMGDYIFSADIPRFEHAYEQTILSGRAW
jgi:hypothetical protein